MRKLLDYLNRSAPRGNFFSRSVNAAPFQILVCLLITGVVVVAAVNEYATNKYLNVGYTPDQPVAFDHSFHAGPDSVLGLDCRYCNNGNPDRGPNQVQHGRSDRKPRAGPAYNRH